MTKPGFPELKFESRCTVCQLAEGHAGLLKAVHRIKAEDNPGEHALYTRVKPMFDSNGVQLPSSRALGRHLDNHVDLTQVAVLSDFDTPDPVEAHLNRLADIEGQLRSINPDDLALGRNDSDYHSMADLFRRLIRRISALDSDPMAFTTRDGDHSFQRLRDWSGLIDNARKIVEGLNKMRNTDRMTVNILEQHTKRYATAIVGPIGEAIRGIRDELTDIDHPRAQDLALRLTLLLDQDVTNIFTAAAVKALRESKEQYKLLN